MYENIVSYEHLSKIFEHNKRLNRNTYVVPKENFGDFTKDELCFVRHVDKARCKIFRSSNGKIFSLSSLRDLEKFKLILSKKGNRK